MLQGHALLRPGEEIEYGCTCVIGSVAYFYPMVKNKGGREEFGSFAKLYIFMLFILI